MVPDQVVTDILKEAPKQSVALTLMRQVSMSAMKQKQPVLTSLPEAYWLNSDTDLKQTTKATWGETFITAEEMAVIVPIPNALIDDANVPLWAEVRPLLVEAIGVRLDKAVLFGESKPDSWPAAVFDGAVAAGNTVASGTYADLGADVAALGQTLSEQGFSINGFISRPGLQWQLVGLRSTNDKLPIYTPSLSLGAPAGLYGFPLNEVDNGAWDADKAAIIAADWSRFVIGMRQDITFDMFSEGVITDAAGKVVLNLMQQDSKALRVVLRVGFAAAIPLGRIGGPNRYPAGAVTPAEPEEVG
jgi:HK97 family phage major capsid protein